MFHMKSVLNACILLVSCLCIVSAYGNQEPDDTATQKPEISAIQSPKEPKGAVNEYMEHVSEMGFIHAFIAAVSVIIVTELGDKTFFIAAILAMRHSRFTVFAGAMTALALMTVLSALLGFASTIIPRAYTYYGSTLLFAIFGLKMLKEGYYMSPNEGQEEYDEAQEEIKKKEEEYNKKDVETADVESGIIGQVLKRRSLVSFISRVFIESFTLTFLAEWGDRSQMATILMAARENVAGVTIGGIIGHSLCTGFAVLGGRFIASRISIRTVTLIGGIVFLMFALSALFIGPDETDPRIGTTK